ncbi:MAG: Ca-activated chloride channel [Blastocatellia bacterium]|jgi:Ca-activated chloride channel family protein|nr:Ca-activated chloride channel [Blastocatellia bacterium]
MSRVYKKMKRATLIVTLALCQLAPAQTQSQTAAAQMVLLQVTVTDSAGRIANDLKQEDFSLTQNGAAQPIAFFSKEEIPLIYGLVIDNSASFDKSLAQIVEAAKNIIQSNKPVDETLVIRFVDDAKLEIVSEFTSDKSALVAALDKLYIGAGPTDIIDAVYLSAEKIKKYKQDAGRVARRAVVLMTDGDNRDSYYTFEQLIKVLQVEHIQVFAIGITANLDKETSYIAPKSQQKKATEFLKNLAQKTGGAAFFPASAADLQAAAGEILRLLRTQYIIGYKPTRDEANKPQGNVTVSVSRSREGDKRVATIRGGYLVADK